MPHGAGWTTTLFAMALAKSDAAIIRPVQQLIDPLATFVKFHKGCYKSILQVGVGIF